VPLESSQAKPRRALSQAVLFILESAPRHGYELHKALLSDGRDISDPALVYHELRVLERENLVTSRWDTPSRGPARRIYALTSAGREALGTARGDI
jgi:PadR family transcriptional regulator PadR